MYLVIGGSASGKSEYAEQLILSLTDSSWKRYYLATMEASDPESLRRIAKHQRRRADWGFQTIETPRNISRAAEQIHQNPGCSKVVLVECISNLLANEMFTANEPVQPGSQEAAQGAIKSITEGIRNICRRANMVVVVSNNVHEDGVTYDEMTQRYINALGEINCRLAEMADTAVEVVCGYPVELKSSRQDTWK